MSWSVVQKVGFAIFRVKVTVRAQIIYNENTGSQDFVTKFSMALAYASSWASVLQKVAIFRVKVTERAHVNSEKMTVLCFLSCGPFFLHPNFIWWYSKRTQEYVGFLQLVLWRSMDRTQGRMLVDDCGCKGSYYCISQQGREMPPATSIVQQNECAVQRDQ